MPDLNAFGTWILNVLLYVPQKIYEYLTDSTITLINDAFSLCSVCSSNTLNAAWASIPSASMWIMSWFMPGTGLTMIVVAYTVRFFIRRIPVIG